MASAAAQLVEEARDIWQGIPDGVRPPLSELQRLNDACGVRTVTEVPHKVVPLALDYCRTVRRVYGLPEGDYRGAVVQFAASRSADFLAVRV